MQKEVIIMGDIEMGGGMPTDDFISDQALSKLILKISREKHPIDLILNGDTFDFLKCPYLKKGKRTHPRHITKEISLAKLKLIHQKHQLVFNALSQFVKQKQHNLYFIIGNHDQDLFYKAVQREIRRILRSNHNVFFRMRYQKNGVYAEHGQQYDLINKFYQNQLFLNYKGQSIINFPWISLGVISVLMSLKEEHPFIERIKPLPTLFTFHKNILKKLSKISIGYLIKSIVYYPYRYYKDPTYFFPKALIREFYRRLKNTQWEIDEVIDVFKWRRKSSLKRIKVAVLSHVHKVYIEQKGGLTFIHPGTWRDEYTLDKNTKKLTSVKKNYVKITISDEGKVDWKLHEQPVERSILNFDEVVKDERKHVLLAAKEEGYIK